MALPCALMASMPPSVMSPGAGMAQKPWPAAASAVVRVSMVTPAPAVTVAGEPEAMDSEVRCWVVSTSTYPAPVLPAGSTIGDQLWLMPLARSRYPLACAQLASVTTSAAEAGGCRAGGLRAGWSGPEHRGPRQRAGRGRAGQEGAPRRPAGRPVRADRIGILARPHRLSSIHEPGTLRPIRTWVACRGNQACAWLVQMCSR